MNHPKMQTKHFILFFFKKLQWQQQQQQQQQLKKKTLRLGTYPEQRNILTKETNYS